MKNMRNARRAIALVLVIVLAVLMGAGSQKSDPSTIHIRNAEDLHELSVACKYDAYSRDKTVLLENDIDLTDAEFTPIPTFGGTFNGQGHTISGLSLSGDGAHMGLFRYIQSGGTVQDLNVSGTVDSAGTLTEIGAIVGTNMGTVTGCNFSGSISGKNNVGGIAGTNESTGMIYNCKSEGFVAGDHYVGGTVGQNLGTVSYCSNTAGVNVNTEDVSVETLDEISLSDENEDEGKAANTSTDVGGIVGFSSGVVIGCTNWGTVGFQHVGYNIGGIAGRQSGLVTGCTNWGTALGRKDVGGIVGQMEPYIELDSGAGSIGKMEQDLNTLHDQMNVLLGHTGAAASDMSATLGSISAAAGRATEHARVVADHTMDYVDETGDTVNELMVRINTSEKMVAPAITEFSQGSIQLETATGYFANGFDYLDAVDEMSDADKTSFKSSANDLSTSTDKLNASMAYLGWLMKAADNAYGTGNYDLESERPDSWERDAEEYGYEYNPDALTTYETIRDAMLRGAGDASSAAGAISGDVSTMTKVINTYYLTEDADGNTRMDNMSAAFNSAFDSLKKSTGHLSTGMSYLDQMAAYLSGNETLSVPTVDSDYRTEMEGMFDELSSISSGLSRLATQTANYSNLIISDMRAVNDTFNVVMLDLCDILQLALDPDAKDIIEDVSEEDYATITTGKVYSCQNYGTADGDVAVGGIAGTMAIEYDFDPESDSTILSETSLTSKYFTKCVLMDSKNYGTAVSRKDYSGGICGESDLGVIVGCEGYGTSESTLGNYVGGIAGLSKGSIRDCYAKCELTGENYVGGVAGFGKNISGCSTLMNLNADGNCVGAIAGELDEEGEASSNYFVHESAAGIDGISYEGKAEALSYEDFMKRDGVPAEFSSFTATFTANGEVVKTIVFAYGASIDESEIPECPVVEGNYGRWPDFDYNNLTFDVEIRAEYTESASSVSGDLLNDDGTPVVILEGVFDPAAKAVVTPSNIEGPEVTGDRDLIAKYDVRVENDSLAEDADRDVSVRVNVPKGGSYNVYTYRDGRWDSVSYTRDGSYLVFEQPNRDITFAVTKSKRSPLLYILLGLALCALLVGGIRALMKRRRKTDETQSEVPAPDTLAPETDRFTEVEDTDARISETAPEVEPAEAMIDETIPEVEDVEVKIAEIEPEAEPVEAEIGGFVPDAEDVEVEIPEIEPEIETPSVEAEAPEIETPSVEIEAPEIAAETPDVNVEAPVAAAAATVAAAAAAEAAKPEKKRGLFSFLRRRDKKTAPAEEAVEEIAKAAEAETAEAAEAAVESADEVDLEALVNEAFETVETAEADSFDRFISETRSEPEAAAEVEAPEVEVETPAVEVEAPEVEIETPAVEVEVPEVEIETPAVEAEIPEVEIEAPAAEAEAPVEAAAAAVAAAAVTAAKPEKKRGFFSFLRRKHPEEAPVVEAEAPEANEPEAEVPAVEVEVPEVEIETPAVEVEAPEVEVETPAVEVEAPEVEIETPAVEVEAPEVEIETPAVAVEVPEVEVETPAVEVEAPEVEVETPAVEVEVPEIEVETPAVEVEVPEVEVETPAAEPTSLETFIANIRSSIADLPADTTVVETADDEIPLAAVPYVEPETPAVEVKAEPVVDEIPLVAVPYVEPEAPAAEVETPAAEPTSLETFIANIRSSIADLPADATVVETAPDEIPLAAVPYVEPETPAVEVKAEPAHDEIPLVAVPYVEPETPAVEVKAEPAHDEVPLIAVPYVEEQPAVDTTSLDNFIASIRGTIAEIPTEAPAVEVPVAEAEVPAAAEVETESHESLDDVIRFVRETCADVERSQSPAEESHESLDELIEQVRGTISSVKAEPTTDSLDDVIRYVKDNLPDDKA